MNTCRGASLHGFLNLKGTVSEERIGPGGEKPFSCPRSLASESLTQFDFSDQEESYGDLQGVMFSLLIALNPKGILRSVF